MVMRRSVELREELGHGKMELMELGERESWEMNDGGELVWGWVIE